MPTGRAVPTKEIRKAAFSERRPGTSSPWPDAANMAGAKARVRMTTRQVNRLIFRLLMEASCLKTEIL
jgi:hypothetical protein